MNGRSDAELLDRMHRGGRFEAAAALEELHRRHAAAVVGFLQNAVSPSLAEDLGQDVFLAAIEHAADFRAGSARPWLLSIAANRLRDRLRRDAARVRRERAAALEREPWAGRPAEAEAAGRLEEAFEALGERERLVLELRFRQGLEHAEVARVLGVSARTAKAWCARGLEALRARMGEGGA